YADHSITGIQLHNSSTIYAHLHTIAIINCFVIKIQEKKHIELILQVMVKVAYLSHEKGIINNKLECLWKGNAYQVHISFKTGHELKC
ncbi:hypothetical protein ACJX0J_031293, partial [Zea mays]